MAKFKAFKVTKPKGKIAYNPSEEELEILKKVDQRYAEAKQARQKREDIWNYSYLQFKSINYYNRQYGQEFLEGFGLRVFVPRTFETIESIIPQINGRPPKFIISGQNPTDDEKARYLSVILENEWRRSDAQKEITVATFDSLVFGTGVLFNYLRDDKLKVRKIKDVDDDGNPVYEVDDMEDYFGVSTRCVDVYNSFPDHSGADANGKDGVRYWIQREVRDVDDLVNEFKSKGFNDNWKYISEGGDVSDFAKVRQEVDNLYTATDVRTPGTFSNLIGQGRSTVDRRPKKDMVEVFHYWERDRYVVIANGVVLRDTPNPYPHKKIPYTLIRDYKLSHELWGVGEPEVMRWLQVEVNTLHNQALDATSMSVGQMMAVNSAYIQDESELVVKPFGVIHLKNIPGIRVQDAIQPIVTPDVKGSVFKMLDNNKKLIQSTTGISDFIIGASRSSSATATEANRLAEASVARIREKARIIEQEGVKDIIEQWIPIIGMFYTEEMVFRVSDKDRTMFYKFVPESRDELTEEKKAQYLEEGYVDVISIDDLIGKFDVNVEGASTLPVNKDVLRNQSMQLLNLAAAVKKPDGSDLFNMELLAEDVLRNFGINNPKQYLNTSATPQITGEVTPEVNLPVSPEEVGAGMSEEDILNQAAQPDNIGNNLLNL